MTKFGHSPEALENGRLILHFIQVQCALMTLTSITLIIKFFTP